MAAGTGREFADLMGWAGREAHRLWEQREQGKGWDPADSHGMETWQIRWERRARAADASLRSLVFFGGTWREDGVTGAGST